MSLCWGFSDCLAMTTREVNNPGEQQTAHMAWSKHTSWSQGRQHKLSPKLPVKCQQPGSFSCDVCAVGQTDGFPQKTARTTQHPSEKKRKRKKKSRAGERKWDWGQRNICSGSFLAESVPLLTGHFVCPLVRNKHTQRDARRCVYTQGEVNKSIGHSSVSFRALS